MSENNVLGDAGLESGDFHPIGVIDASFPSDIFAGSGFEDIIDMRDLQPDSSLFNGDLGGFEAPSSNNFGIIEAGSEQAQTAAVDFVEAELAKIQTLYDEGEISQTQKATREAQAIGDASLFYGLGNEETAKAVNAVYSQYGVSADFDANNILNANGSVNVAENNNGGLISNRFPNEVTSASSSGGSPASLMEAVIGAIGGATAAGTTSGGSSNNTGGGNPNNSSSDSSEASTGADGGVTMLLTMSLIVLKGLVSLLAAFLTFL